MSDKKGYAGRIQNSGAQKVEAPFGDAKKGKASVKTGEDLRSGNRSGGYRGGKKSK